MEEPRCWIRSPHRPARLFRGGLSAATLSAQAAESPAKRRTGPQPIDSTRSSTPTRRGKASKTSGKWGRFRTLISTLESLARHLEEPRCWIRPPHRSARLFVANSRVRLWAQHRSRPPPSLPAKSTGRATGGRLRPVYDANTQRKGFKPRFKVDRIDTFEANSDALSSLVERHQ